jgi:hypothetical protein
MILNTIKQRRLDARRSGDRVVANLLSTLLGECDRQGKTPVAHVLTDGEVFGTVRLMLKRNRETASLIEPDQTRAAQRNMLDREKAALTDLLPMQMCSNDLVNIVRPMCAKHTIAEVMTRLKAEYAGLYDPQIAISIVKTVYDESVAQPP